MGKRTSVYLSDELHEAWRASGVPLAELVRQALSAGEDGLAIRIGHAALRLMTAAGHATPSGTGTAEVPQSAGTANGGTATEVPPSAHATSSGTHATDGGTPAAAKGKTPRTRRAEPAASLPLALSDAGLTVASALPKPRRCNHPGKRSVGGFCPDCDHLIQPGGAWA